MSVRYVQTMHANLCFLICLGIYMYTVFSRAGRNMSLRYVRILHYRVLGPSSSQTFAWRVFGRAEAQLQLFFMGSPVQVQSLGPHLVRPCRLCNGCCSRSQNFSLLHMVFFFTGTLVVELLCTRFTKVFLATRCKNSQGHRSVHSHFFVFSLASVQDALPACCSGRGTLGALLTFAVLSVLCCLVLLCQKRRLLFYTRKKDVLH